MLGARIIDISSFKRQQDVRRAMARNVTPQPVLWILLSGKTQPRIIEKHKDFYRDIIWTIAPSSEAFGSECDTMQELADFLLEARCAHAYDRLITIAPTDTMDQLHQALPLEAQASVCAQIPADLSHLSLQELQKALEDIVVI